MTRKSSGKTAKKASRPRRKTVTAKKRKRGPLPAKDLGLHAVDPSGERSKLVSRVYDIPFRFQSHKKYSISDKEVAKVFKLEKSKLGKRGKGSAYAMVLVRFRDTVKEGKRRKVIGNAKDDDYAWIYAPRNAEIDISTPEKSAAYLQGLLATRLAHYDIASIGQVRLHFITSKETWKDYTSQEGKKRKKHRKRIRTKKKNGKRLKKVSKVDRRVPRNRAKKNGPKMVKKTKAIKRHVKTPPAKRRSKLPVRDNGYRKRKGRKVAGNRSKLSHKRKRSN